MSATIPVDDYLEVSASVSSADKPRQGFAKVYVQKALWSIAINLEKTITPDQLQQRSLEQRLRYLLESFFLAEHYLIGKRFPWVVPVIEPEARHKIVDIVYQIQTEENVQSVYLGCSNFCVLETPGRLNYELRPL